MYLQFTSRVQGASYCHVLKQINISPKVKIAKWSSKIFKLNYVTQGTKVSVIEITPRKGHA